MSVQLQVDRLEGSLKSYVESKSGFADETKQSKILLRLFNEFDTDSSGYLDEEEFEAVLVQRLNVVGCKQVIEELFDRYDADVSGYISYNEFVDALYASAGTESKENWRGAARDPTHDKHPDIVRQVKEKILARAGRNAGIRACTRILCAMDKDGSRTLSAEEIQEGMGMFGVVVTGQQTKALMQYFDRDRSGKISIEEFLRGLRGRMSRQRKRLVRLAWEQLCVALEKDGPNDRITVHDMGKFYDASNHPEVVRGFLTEEDVIREFMGSWDRDGDNEITWHEFLDYYRDLSAGIELDDYFELMVRNAWHLSGGEGWCENTSNRRVLVTLRDGRQVVEEIANDFTMSRTPSKDEVIARLEKNGVEGIADVSLFD